MELSERDSSLFVVRCGAITTFGEVLDEFPASLAKESVGRTYAADSEEEAEWDCFFGVVWVARCPVNLGLYATIFLGRNAKLSQHLGNAQI